MMRWLTRFPMAIQAMVIGMLVSLVVGVVLDTIQSRQFRTVVGTELQSELGRSLRSVRHLMDDYRNRLSSTVRLIAESRHLFSYVRNRQTWPEKADVSAILFHAKKPVWLPPSGQWRPVLPQSFLLLDAQGHVREFYSIDEHQPDPVLMASLPLFLARSVGQVLVTELSDGPGLVVSAPIQDTEGRIYAYLMVLRDLNDDLLRFLYPLTGVDDLVVAIFRGIAPHVQVVADNILHDKHAFDSYDALMKDYLIIGKGFEDYGSSEVAIQLTGLVNKQRIGLFSDRLMEMERMHRAILGALLVLAQLSLALWVVYRVRHLTRWTLKYTKEQLHSTLIVHNRGDELLILADVMTRMGEKNRRSQEVRATITELLRRALASQPLQTQLQGALDLILEKSWLTDQKKAAIYRFDLGKDRLVLEAERGFSAEMLQTCALVQRGSCQCGQAFDKVTLIFDAHHGRYSLPILAQGRLLGLFVQYVGEGHVYDVEEEEFLWTLSHTLAGLIERYQMDQKLADAKAVAETSNRAKSEFLANMSHEIRTPMNAIMGLGHLLFKTELSGKQKNYLQKINTASRSLLGILNDILDFSKIEAKKLPLESIPFHLESVFGNVADLIAPKAAEKDLEFLFSMDPTTPMALVGDPLRLGQVLINLTNNAVKFTESGEIVLTVSPVHRGENFIWLRFSIRDTGIGLTPEQLGRLFSAFSQADTSTTRQYGGTGLGLTISEQLVGMMGGRIQVTSVFGQGSTFEFTASFGLSEQTFSTLAPKKHALGAMRVLVVDDNSSSREILADLLHSFSLECVLVESGYAAAELLKKQQNSQEKPFDLILMDWMMPGMDGIETSRQIKQDLALSHTPTIIMVTSHAREEVVRQAEKVGIDGFLSKPLSPSSLLDTLVDLCGEGKQGIITLGTLDNEEALEHQLRETMGGARVLLAEDNPINRQIATEILESLNVQVLQAVDGVDAVEQVLNQKETFFDAVFMDLQMPKQDGFAATQQIRAQAGYQQVPIIAMTAHAMVGDREKCLAAGMNDHVSKPIEIKELYASLSRWIKPGKRSVVVQKRDISSDISFPEACDCIHVEEGLRRVRGNRALLQKMIMDFGREHAEADSQLRAKLAAGDIEGAQQQIHAIKGVSGNIAATALHKISQQLEQQLKEEVSVEERDLGMEDFSRELQRVVTASQSFNPKVASEENHSLVDADAPLPIKLPDNFQEDLALFAQMLASNNLTAKRLFPAIRDRLVGRTLEADLAELEQCIERLKFVRAGELVQQLAKHLNLTL